MAFGLEVDEFQAMSQLAVEVCHQCFGQHHGLAIDVFLLEYTLRRINILMHQ